MKIFKWACAIIILILCGYAEYMVTYHPEKIFSAKKTTSITITEYGGDVSMVGDNPDRFISLLKAESDGKDGPNESAAHTSTSDTTTEFGGNVSMVNPAK